MTGGIARGEGWNNRRGVREGEDTKGKEERKEEKKRGEEKRVEGSMKGEIEGR